MKITTRIRVALMNLMLIMTVPLLKAADVLDPEFDAATVGGDL